MSASRCPLANCPASRFRNRHPRGLDNRRDSHGPAGDSPTACPWRSEDVASARDACRFPAMACRWCNATNRATPRALPRLPLRRRTPPSDGPAGCRDAVIFPGNSGSEDIAPDQPSSQTDCQPGAEIHWFGLATQLHDTAWCAPMYARCGVVHLGTRRAMARPQTWVRAVHDVRAFARLSEIHPTQSFIGDLTNGRSYLTSQLIRAAMNARFDPICGRHPVDGQLDRGRRPYGGTGFSRNCGTQVRYRIAALALTGIVQVRAPGLAAPHGP